MNSCSARCDHVLKRAACDTDLENAAIPTGLAVITVAKRYCRSRRAYRYRWRCKICAPANRSWIKCEGCIRCGIRRRGRCDKIDSALNGHCGPAGRKCRCRNAVKILCKCGCWLADRECPGKVYRPKAAVYIERQRDGAAASCTRRNGIAYGLANGCASDDRSIICGASADYLKCHAGRVRSC